GDPSEPEVKRDRRGAEVFGETTAGFEQGALDHVARIDAAAEGAIQPLLDLAAQRLPMARQQTVERRRVVPGGVEQGARLGRVGPHGKGGKVQKCSPTAL